MKTERKIQMAKMKVVLVEDEGSFDLVDFTDGFRHSSVHSFDTSEAALAWLKGPMGDVYELVCE